MTRGQYLALACFQALLWASFTGMFTDSGLSAALIAVASLSGWLNGWVDAKNEKGQPVSEPPPK